MSAGWQQRVAIAAGICSGSKVLLLDEPLSALDIQASEMFFDTLTELKRQKITVVIAEHRIKELQEMSDSFLTIDSGNLTARFADQANLKARIWPAGNVLAVLGSNGSGKTSMLRKLADAGGVLVPQPASDLLYLDTVAEELKQADIDANQPSGSAARLFYKFGPRVNLNQNPRDLSEGQKLALAISIQLVKPLKQLLLDEPTLGFDTPSRQQLVDTIFEIAQVGTEVIVATHDLEFATAIANRTERLQSRELSDVS
jgi:energy-coupling factor transporter ATP-binding protein EcfA2